MAAYVTKWQNRPDPLPEPDAMLEGRPRRLDSWKEIADYLARDIRTVIRWEKERGLPVRRLPGRGRSAVFADADEIDRWLRAGPTSPLANGVGPEGWVAGERGAGAVDPLPVVSSVSPARRSSSRRLLWLTASAGVGALVTLMWSLGSFAHRPRHISGIVLEGDSLVAKGGDGAVLWRHALGHVAVGDPSFLIHAPIDLDGDAIPEHLVEVAGKGAGSLAGPHELFCLSAFGKPRWSVRLTDELVFGGGRYGPPWVGPNSERGSLVASYEVGGARRVAWIQNHRLWWPGVLTVLDSRGRTVSKWVHAGNLRAMAVLPGDPPQLLVAGTSNSRAAAFLAVLDARNVSGSGPEEPGSPYKCLSCVDGRPLRYFVFPPSELTLATLLPYNHGVDVRVLDDGFEVHTIEAGDTRFRLNGIFRFSLDFQLEHAAWSDGWLPTHRRFEHEGKVDHAAEQCAEAKHPPTVLAWDPSKGFDELVPRPTTTDRR